MEKNMQHFWHIMLYYFKKGKNATEKQKKICAVYGEGAVTDGTCQKVVCKVSWYYWHFSQVSVCCGSGLCIGRCLAAALASTHQKPIVRESQHTQNVPINKVMHENENVSFISWKQCNELFGQPDNRKDWKLSRPLSLSDLTFIKPTWAATKILNCNFAEPWFGNYSDTWNGGINKNV